MEPKYISNYARPDKITEPLYVIAPIFNSKRYRSRWKLYEDFAKHVADAGGILHTIECAFGEREFVIKQNVNDPCNQRLIQVRTNHELWIKENLINIAVSRLPSNWKYIAIVDADTLFARCDWTDETKHLLQHYPVIQMFSQCQDLSPNYEAFPPEKGMMYLWNMYGDTIPDKFKGSPYSNRFPGHPGFCWAFTREAWNNLGGLIDYCILGSADSFMAHAFMGKLNNILKKDYHPEYTKRLKIWQDRAETYIKRNVGYMPGLVLHYWHGAKVNRQYKSRDNILTGNQYNPDLDIKLDSQGLYQLTDRNWKLRDEIRKYFSERNEDDISLIQKP